MNSLRHLESLQKLPLPTVRALLDRAVDFRRVPRQPLLEGKKLGLVFFNPSLRTRVSFQAAMADLGGQAFALDVGGGLWKIEVEDGKVMDGDAAEHVKEAVKVLSRYVDALGVRAFAEGKDWATDRADPVLAAFLRHSDVPVVNMESGLYHPCQALADMRTIEDKLGAVKGKKVALVWAWHPKPLPLAVPQSFALAASRLGAELTIVAPEGYGLDPAVQTAVENNARASGGSERIVSDRAEGLAGAEVAYVKSWGSLDLYGRPAEEAKHRAGLRHWIFDEAAHRMTAGAIVMHCLPVRRNVVISDPVLDGPRSVVYDQAENRLHVQKAILEWMLAGERQGRP
ncbi:MAG: N-acetylornithine carbamoyltransferase [Planctomycetes bacterium]|nr:N-acetylornithine carbamoyltransferase [Planctomycetota bacterium]